jgi:hypothetical protein
MDKSVNKIDRHFRKIQSNNFILVPPSPPPNVAIIFLSFYVIQQHCVGGRDVLDKIQESNYKLNSHRGKLKFY